ncbi:DUF5810 domain-containing protein [Haladaptatus sp. DYSN1]|uniref:DUF5810 domain-containing protein n=1 Tax=unclassified Haladaptatus TaxID=2622732 RepID=UPI0024056F5A|nr:DUF5810 domain-containing protein [Haladaptatus sp. DYSN1]
MGYACPVCDAPQMDGKHLANHLAFTAMLGNADHETWLDEHAPGWSDEGHRELAARVTEFAEEREYPQVFEDTTDQHDHEHDDDVRPGDLFEDDTENLPHDIEPPEQSPQLDAKTQEAIEEAKRMAKAHREADEDENA